MPQSGLTALYSLRVFLRQQLPRLPPPRKICLGERRHPRRTEERPRLGTVLRPVGLAVVVVVSRPAAAAETEHFGAVPETEEFESLCHCVNSSEGQILSITQGA